MGETEPKTERSLLEKAWDTAVATVKNPGAALSCVPVGAVGDVDGVIKTVQDVNQAMNKLPLEDRERPGILAANIRKVGFLDDTRFKSGSEAEEACNGGKAVGWILGSVATGVGAGKLAAGGARVISAVARTAGATEKIEAAASITATSGKAAVSVATTGTKASGLSGFLKSRWDAAKNHIMGNKAAYLSNFVGMWGIPIGVGVWLEGFYRPNHPRPETQAGNTAVQTASVSQKVLDVAPNMAPR